MIRDYTENGFVKIIDNDILIIPQDDEGVYRWINQCCDCGLVHIFEFTMDKNVLSVKINRFDGDMEILHELYDIIPAEFKGN